LDYIINKNKNKNKKMKSYSQSGQDLFVINMLPNISGTFLDLGCSHPTKINNTYLLEINGWTGVSVDLADFSSEWSERKNKFINSNCLNLNYNNFLNENYENKVIDYLTLDMERPGDRFEVLQKVMNSDFEFKIITLEHDAYLGAEFIQKEQIPQRKLLKEKGYYLICSDVSQKEFPELNFEDWWVNEKYFNLNEIKKWESENLSCDKIFEKCNILYEKIS
jgi:hypothetical protein